MVYILSSSAAYKSAQLYILKIFSRSSFWVGKLKTTIREPTAVPVVGLQGCCSTSLFWDRTASVPGWCSSASNVFKYSNYDRSHAVKWTRAHCLQCFGLLWGLPHVLSKASQKSEMSKTLHTYMYGGTFIVYIWTVENNKMLTYRTVYISTVPHLHCISTAHAPNHYHIH